MSWGNPAPENPPLAPGKTRPRGLYLIFRVVFPLFHMPKARENSTIGFIEGCSTFSAEVNSPKKRVGYKTKLMNGIAPEMN
jgi:hypothetical protein